MILLAIDPGSKVTGWALLEANGAGIRRLDSGTICPTPTKLAKWACRFDPIPELVVCERVVLTYKTAVAALSESLGAIQQALGTRIPPKHRIHTSVIHSRLGGKGPRKEARARVRAYVERVVEGWGPGRDENETDAAAVGVVVGDERCKDAQGQP